MRDDKVDIAIGIPVLQRVRRELDENHVQVLYCVARPMTVSLLRGCGTNVSEVPAQLRTDDLHAAATFHEFSKYWRRTTVGTSGSGNYVYNVSTTDNTGAGWTITVRFQVQNQDHH